MPDVTLRLRCSACGSRNVKIAYDLLGVNGEDLRKMPLHERGKRLESVLSGNGAFWSLSCGTPEGSLRFTSAVFHRRQEALASTESRYYLPH